MVLERSSGLSPILISHDRLERKKFLQILINNPLGIRYDFWQGTGRIFIYNTDSYALYRTDTGEPEIQYNLGSEFYLSLIDIDFISGNMLINLSVDTLALYNYKSNILSKLIDRSTHVINK